MPRLPAPAVYALVDSDGVIGYVGATMRSPGRRLDEARKRVRTHPERQPDLRAWMVAHEPVHVEALEASPADMTEAEEYWIARCRSNGHDIVNRQRGGPGYPGRPTEAHKAALRHPKSQYVIKDAAARSRQMAAACHVRWHANRGRTSPDCPYC